MKQDCSVGVYRNFSNFCLALYFIIFGWVLRIGLWGLRNLRNRGGGRGSRLGGGSETSMSLDRKEDGQ
jgi:hypothetical protein